MPGGQPPERAADGAISASAGQPQGFGSEQVPAASGSDWWHDGVVYQIYPRSFADTNGDGIGDLAGILEHLDHLGGAPDSLGIDAIWLSPFFPSPDCDFGYDVADYLGVDPKYGTLADFERLVEGCHARGIRVLIDLVLNHSSSEHAWFQASRASRTGQYADWYIWRDSPGRSLTGGRRPPNNWRSWFGGSAWTWDDARQQFYLHTFLPQQPDLNWRNPEVRAALLGVVRTWLDRGVDGFRLDVFNTFFKHERLHSNPRRFGGRGLWSWQRHLYDRNQPELLDLLHELRAIIDERPGRMSVGELFDGSLVEAAPLIQPRHLVFDWSMINIPWSASAFRAAIETRDAAFGPERWPANVLSNHDQPRHAGRLAPRGDGPANASEGDARARVAAALLMTLRGTPFLYYGEELGLRNLAIPNAEALDPPARRASFLFPWWNRDQARGPMPWDPSPGAGFTTGRPWLPLPPDFARRNVATQAATADSILNTYRQLLRLRRQTPALFGGEQELLSASDPRVLAYLRSSGEGRAFVALNFASREVAITVPPPDPRGGWRVAFSTAGRAASDPLTASLTLAPLEALVATD